MKGRKRLQILSNSLNKKYIKNNIGSIQNVLFEKYENGLLQGLTENYIRIFTHGNKNLVNKIKKVKILDHQEFVFGELVE